MSGLLTGRHRAALLIVTGLLFSCSGEDASTARSEPVATSTSTPTASTAGSTSAAPPSGSTAPANGPTASLFVLEANGGAATAVGAAQTYDLSLTGIGGVTWFSDRPARVAGDESVARFVEAWPDRFASSPPNAALTIGEGDDANVAIVTLSDPVVDADTLRFRATVVDPAQAPPALHDHAASRPALELPRTFDRAALFVDPSGAAKSISATLTITDAPTFQLQLSVDGPTILSLSSGPATVAVEGPGAIVFASVEANGMNVRGTLTGSPQVVSIDIPLSVVGPTLTGDLLGEFPAGSQVTLQFRGGGATPLAPSQPFAIPVP